MSVKTCQLCGKPLGRMRGADGEFCSREHRNQFHMRQGLDRLEEANKVASLMRRRENLKPIPTTQLAAGTGGESRAVVTPAQYPARTLEAGFPELKPQLFEVRVAEVPERYRRPIARWSQGPSGAGKQAVGPHWLPLSKQTRTGAVLCTLQVAQPRTGVAQAQLVQVRRAVPATKETWRECGAALQMARKPKIPSAGFTLEAPGAKRLKKVRGFQKVPETALAEISSESQAAPRFEFERQKPTVRIRTRKPAGSGGLKQPQISGLSKPAAIEASSDLRWCVGPRLESPMRLPRFRAKQQAAAASRGEIIRLQPSGYDSVSQQPRWCNGTREMPAVASVSLQSLPFRGRGFMTADVLPMTMARDSANDWRPAQVRFEPEDTAFEPSLLLQGSLDPGEADGGAGRPIEEHFNEGLEQWSGDTLEWRLDAAGARPAGLALFRPTLEMSDYEFEFFTRIESRAVTYVFRASNVSNYLKVTIAMVESGRYELRHSAVIGGIEEAAVASPLPGVIRPGSAFTVKTRASQNDFTIWLDGELAVKWKDGRLPTGGIGFMAPRDDRARVYWVRLSQADGNSKAATVRPIRSIQ